MGAMKNFIKSLLSEDQSVSATRFSLLCGVFFIFLLVLVICYVVIYDKGIEYINALTTTITVIAGIFLTSKVWQKSIEVKGNNESKSIETNINNANDNESNKQI